MTAGERAVSVGRRESLLKKERRRARSACRERERERGEKWAGIDGKSERRNPGLCTGQTQSAAARSAAVR